MENVKGTCLCGKNQVTIKHYGNFVYSCHCDMCRKMSAGPVMAIDPEKSENVDLKLAEDSATYYRSNEEVERCFCSTCGTYLFWHHLGRDHFCLNAELFPEIIRNADFSLQLFYDRKPDYYDFANKTTYLDHNFQEVSD